MDEQVDGWLEGWVNGNRWMNGQVDGEIYQQMDG